MSLADSRGLSIALITLLKGALIREENETRWQMLMEAEPRVRDHARVLGLELVVVEDEGYAFLRQQAGEEQEDIPRLVSRRPLSYAVSLLLALLRRKLIEHETSTGEARLIVDVTDMVEALRTFLPEGRTEARMTDQIGAHLRRIADLGFIRFLKNDPERFEVKRILKAFVTAQWLQEMETRLAAESLGTPDDDQDNEESEDDNQQLPQ